MEGAAAARPSAAAGATAALIRGRRTFEVVVLGQLPPASRASEQRIRGAGPHDALAWEIRQALEAIGAGAPTQWRRIEVVALRCCPGREGSAPPPPPALAGSRIPAQADQAGRGWLGGLLFGESVAQIIFRLALHLQQYSAPLAGGSALSAAIAEEDIHEGVEWQVPIAGSEAADEAIGVEAVLAMDMDHEAVSLGASVFRVSNTEGSSSGQQGAGSSTSSQPIAGAALHGAGRERSSQRVADSANIGTAPHMEGTSVSEHAAMGQ